MKATKLAHFFDCMRRQMISFDVNDVNGLSFEDFFGAKGDGAEQEREGTYLTAYVTDNSVAQDFFLESAKENMGSPTIHKYPSPYTDNENELMYIIKITNDEDEE